MSSPGSDLINTYICNINPVILNNKKPGFELLTSI